MGPRRNSHLKYIAERRPVRDGGRVAGMGQELEDDTKRAKRRRTAPHSTGQPLRASHEAPLRRGMEAFGQLVALGFGVAAFTPAPYLRRSLRRPSKEL